MFTGEYRHNLDSKNRLIIPAKYRDELGEVFFITKGDDGCLTVYSKEQFEEKLRKISEIPSTKAEQRAYLRELTSSAQDCSLDNQGRIQLNPLLKKKAALNKNVVIIGVYDRIEIWPEELWDSYNEQCSSEFEANGEKLTGYMK